MKIKNIHYIVIVFVIVLLSLIYYRRKIYINSLSAVYDLYSLYGFYWKLTPEYCSSMKMGFTPVMPLEFYADFNKAIFQRIPLGDNNINQSEIIKICDRNYNWLLENGKIWNEPIKLEVLYVDSHNFKQKMIQNIDNNFPFVIRGIRLKCFETMKFDKLIEKIGNQKIYMSPTLEESCPENVFTEFKNITKNKCYISNATNIFSYYDDLLPDSDMDIIKHYIDDKMSNDSKQLFVGVVKNSGTRLHAAYSNNFFIMIHGQKKWTFFNPNQLALLYPNFQKKGIYMASESRFLNMDTEREYIYNKFPLMKYVPRYEVDLEEGDILYNPASWFHSVYNKTDISVACSTRWSNKYAIPERHMLRYGNLINPELRNYVKEIYERTGIIGITQIDEHKHMLDETDIDTIPFWDKYTNDQHNLCKNSNCSKNWHSNL